MQGHSPEETRRGVGWAWLAATAAVCAAFWGVLYFASLRPLQEKLAGIRAVQAQAEQELPTAQAQPELPRVDQQLAELKRRWETTTAAEAARQLEAHSVTLRMAEPGEEPGTFVLEVEGSAHGLGQALPEIEKAAPGGRLPAVLYFRKVKQDPRRPGRFRLEGAGRISDWELAPPAAESE